MGDAIMLAGWQGDQPDIPVTGSPVARLTDADDRRQLRLSGYSDR